MKKNASEIIEQPLSNLSRHLPQQSTTLLISCEEDVTGEPALVKLRPLNSNMSVESSLITLLNFVSMAWCLGPQ